MMFGHQLQLIDQRETPTWLKCMKCTYCNLRISERIIVPSKMQLSGVNLIVKTRHILFW